MPLLDSLLEIAVSKLNNWDVGNFSQLEEMGFFTTIESMLMCSCEEKFGQVVPDFTEFLPLHAGYKPSRDFVKLVVTIFGRDQSHGYGDHPCELRVEPRVNLLQVRFRFGVLDSSHRTLSNRWTPDQAWPTRRNDWAVRITRQLKGLERQ